MKKSLLMAVFTIGSLLTQAQNPTLLGHLSYNTSCAGIWHYVDSLGNEYALVGAGDRVSIVNVTNPVTPVEVFNVPALPGENSLWREVKTYGKYAYAVSEAGGGVIVIDLSNLPASINSKHWYGDSTINGLLNVGHTIAATDGYIYIFGSDIGVGGVIIADISDPWNPRYTGQYNLNYVHDGYIRNDTLWAGEIYIGQFAVIDVTNKANPVLITNQQTPGQFCHNTWLSDNGEYLFTTDEQPGAPLGSFKVSDLGNIQLKTIYYCDSAPNEEVHNVRVLNDFLINPNYGSHLTIVDAARPENLVEIGDISASFNASPQYLCWDASPYLPSGNIIATDVYGGLFIYQPTYVRACYLEGTTTDSITNNSISDVKVEIMATTKTTTTDISGNYKTGIPTAGTYDIHFSKPGYIPKTYYNISLSNGVLTNINAEMVSFSVSGQVSGQLTLLGLQGANVSASNGVNVYYTTTDANGNYVFTDVVFGTYTVTAAKWGYVSSCVTQLLDGSAPINFLLGSGFMDDFATGNAWTINSTCSTGVWTRGIPKGTTLSGNYANPPADVSTDCADLCYITGNGGGSSTNDDVDNGFTSLNSPVFDLTSYSNPFINYARWFFINSNVNPTSSDTLFITIDNGFNTATLELATLNTAGNGTWVFKNFKVSDYLIPTSTMTLTLFVSDKTGSGNVVEAGLDNFLVTEGTLGINDLNNTDKQLIVFPNPFNKSFFVKINAELLTQKSMLSLYDLEGRNIYSTLVTGNTTEVIIPAEISKGIYILKAANTNRIIPPVKVISQ